MIRDGAKNPAEDPRPLPVPCPLCGGVVTSEVGVWEEPVLTGFGTIARAKRLGRFSACTGCEFAVVGTWTGVESDAAVAV